MSPPVPESTSNDTEKCQAPLPNFPRYSGAPLPPGQCYVADALMREEMKRKNSQDLDLAEDPDINNLDWNHRSTCPKQSRSSDVWDHDILGPLSRIFTTQSHLSRLDNTFSIPAIECYLSTLADKTMPNTPDKSLISLLSACFLPLLFHQFSSSTPSRIAMRGKKGRRRLMAPEATGNLRYLGTRSDRENIGTSVKSGRPSRPLYP
ncbi:hypothetical protein BS47DRAFT_1485908 [Hydnum rufescens UP504]|uniref:Uncharacterized protein n=1 Tax=Hydnum rufescens UP504 TaxID=1448309 RepID=A0A9P6DSB7_9AGAM|nr:hypothetical protein BS47DRAFT_1485908 [Hydnum rufescens UP504]